MKKKITVKVPESLDEISVKSFQLLMKINDSELDSITKSIRMIEVISTLSEQQINTLDDHSLVKIAEHISILLSSSGKLTILNEFNNSQPIDLNKLTLGQFVDIFMLLNDKIGNAQFILTQYYYKGAYVGTDYSYSAMFDSYPISAYSLVYDKIAKFYKDITEEYATIFKGEVSEEKILTNQGAFNKKWGWYTMFANLANNNVLNIEAVSNLPFREALTFQSYMMDVNKISN